jgi:hypothetical protein
MIAFAVSKTKSRMIGTRSNSGGNVFFVRVKRRFFFPKARFLLRATLRYYTLFIQVPSSLFNVFIIIIIIII